VSCGDVRSLAREGHSWRKSGEDAEVRFAELGESERADVIAQLSKLFLYRGFHGKKHENVWG
jgi:hypothetical protein